MAKFVIVKLFMLIKTQSAIYDYPLYESLYISQTIPEKYNYR